MERLEEEKDEISMMKTRVMYMNLSGKENNYQILKRCFKKMSK